jgi:hypothetical protein
MLKKKGNNTKFKLSNTLINDFEIPQTPVF